MGGDCLAAIVSAVSWRQGVGRRPLSVAAFGRVLRTLGGKNIGKCRLRAHQHPLLPPLSYRCRTAVVSAPMQNIQGKTRRQRVMERVLREWAAFVHRFLISGPNLGIDVSFSPFTPSFVHRFLISRPNLRIDVSFSGSVSSSVSGAGPSDSLDMQI